MKRLLLISMTFAVLLGALPAAIGAEPEGQTFSDVPAGSWFENGVKTCVQSGVMVGTGEGRFSPETPLTQAECVMLAYRLYDRAQGGDGSVMKMPEGHNDMKLFAADGALLYEGSAGDDSRWRAQALSFSPYGLRLILTGPIDVTAATEEKSDVPFPLTLTLNGAEYRGRLESSYQGHMREDALAFVPEEDGVDEILTRAVGAVAPGRWWSDLGYTLEQKGLTGRFPGYYLNSGEAQRYVFARLIASAVELPARLSLSAIPDVRQERGAGGWSDGVWELYEAGILGGVDAYGTFAPTQTLTRAEAAVMAARVADESQRLTQPPRPMPTEGEGYTLTCLMDGVFASSYLQDTYPCCVVGEPAVYVAPKELLSLDGALAPWPGELPAECKAPEDWQNWGGLWVDNESVEGQMYYRREDGTPATEWFDWCGKVGPRGMGFVQKDGKICRIEFTGAGE